jgi:hypothetical protein
VYYDFVIPKNKCVKKKCQVHVSLSGVPLLQTIKVLKN